jgi:hypothetical protein
VLWPAKLHSPQSAVNLIIRINPDHTSFLAGLDEVLCKPGIIRKPDCLIMVSAWVETCVPTNNKSIVKLHTCGDASSFMIKKRPASIIDLISNKGCACSACGDLWPQVWGCEGVPDFNCQGYQTPRREEASASKQTESAWRWSQDASHLAKLRLSRTLVNR